MKKVFWMLFAMVCAPASAQTPFPEGATILGSKDVHDGLLGKAFATMNTDGKGKPVGDKIEFLSDSNISFTEGAYSGNFVFEKGAYKDTLTMQGSDGQYCSQKYKWCLYARTQDEKLLTRWGSEDGKNKPILVWSPYINPQ